MPRQSGATNTTREPQPSHLKRLSLKSSRTWENVILTIDVKSRTVRHDDDPEMDELTNATPTHYSWHQDKTLITDGSFNRIAGSGEVRMTMDSPGFLMKNVYESCKVAPAPPL